MMENNLHPHFYSPYELVSLHSPIPTQRHLLMPLGNKLCENTVGKGETARNKQFLLFPQCFLPVWITFCHFCLKLSSANFFSLEESKISSGNGLRVSHFRSEIIFYILRLLCTTRYNFRLNHTEVIHGQKLQSFLSKFFVCGK